jgi:7-carboxy-7-deazaguanine synthase
MQVIEIFRSLQGEGIHMGAPTAFVRFAGCNLRCEWCDTKYAYEGGTERTSNDIFAEVLAMKTRHVCITGGEPLLQIGISRLINRFLANGKQVTLETNGTQSLEDMPCDPRLTISMDVKCPSSKMEGDTLEANFEVLGPTDQLKFVIANQEDYNFARGVLKNHKVGCEIIFTPMGGTNLKWLAEAVLKDKLEVRAMPQLHKLIWGEERGR